MTRNHHPTHHHPQVRPAAWCFPGLLVLTVLGSLIPAGDRAADAQIIYCKVAVDEETPTAPEVYRERLSARLDAASRIFNQYCQVKFVPIEFTTWDSDDRVHDLERSVREFELEVSPGRAQVAIGFSSQYKFQAGRHGMGGTRGPMYSHIFLKDDAPNVFELDKLEVLVHELGHYLGAAHTTDQDSAMRPVLGDGKPRVASFRIGFDPINARIVNLMGREIRDRHIRSLGQVSRMTLLDLRTEYAKLAALERNDETAKRYLGFIDRCLRQNPSRP